MILWIFGTADLFLCLPVMLGPAQFVIQQLLPKIGSEMHRPTM